MLRRKNVRIFEDRKSTSEVRWRLCSSKGVERLRYLLLVVSLLAVAGGGWAQTNGTLLGSVTDQNGAAIPSASVRVTNTDTGFTKTATPTSEGSYVIPLLPIGHYSIFVTATGFESFTQSGVLVAVAQDIRVDVKLQIGQVAQTVTVNGNAINIDTTTATLGETVDNERLENLPLNGRNAANLLATLPGVANVSAPVFQTSAR